jgi:predicted nucleotidyltransferase
MGLDLDRLASELRSLLGRYPEIAAAWIFGSAVRGELRFDSDVDVGVLFREGAGDRERILADLAARLETLTSPYPADVVDLEPQGVIFAHGVLCDGRRVYEADRDRRVDFESDTAVRAFDFRPTYERALRGQREGLLRRLAEDQSR